ncbi:MAG: CoA transferase subunit A, partial [Terriglobia bacterium]
MAEITTIDELAENVPSGVRLGVGGVHFARLPMALIGKVIASGKGQFTFISWGGGLPLELFLEAGAIKKLAFCFSSLDIFGLAPRFRETLEKGAIEVEEWSALAMIEGLKAAQFNLPEMPFQLPHASSLMERGNFWRQSNSAFTGEAVGQARRLDIDVLLLHAQRADREGNVEIQGARGLDLSLIGASKRVLVTVDEIVETGRVGSAPRSFALPKAFVTAIACAPFGAYPTSCLPYYTTDYSRLLAYASAEQARRKATGPARPAGEPDQGSRNQAFLCDETRKRFLSQAAKCTVQALTPARLRPHASIVQEGSPFTIDELLAVCLAREYDNSSIC